VNQPAKLALLAFITSLVHFAAVAEPALLRVATTTTTDNSGLMEVLIPAFEKKTNYTTRVVAVGTGKALRLLANGDVDVALTHAPSLEIALIDADDAVNRRQFMYNDFVVIGPQSDPASIRDAGSIERAFSRIRDRQSTFVSRGDGSGTHEREKIIWQLAGLVPTGDWYREAGQGMGHTLQIAGQLGGYTLTDRGTWLAYEGRSPLNVLYQGDEHLFNIYSVMAASPEKYADLNHSGAAALTVWLLSAEAAQLIRDFRIDGRQLFIPLLNMSRN